MSAYAILDYVHVDAYEAARARLVEALSKVSFDV